MGLSVRPFVRPSIYQTFETFETSHIFRTMYARILKFHICVAYKKNKLTRMFCVFLPFLSYSSLWN